MQVSNLPWTGKLWNYSQHDKTADLVYFIRILSHPEVSDEPEEETTPPQALGTASAASPSNQDEGKPFHDIHSYIFN